MTDISNNLALNAIATITLRIGNSPFTNTIFARSQGTPNEPIIIETYPEYPEWGRGPEPPQRPPSNLPPNGCLHLALEVSHRIDHGLSGSVYLTSLCLSESSPEVALLDVPSLVVKIAAEGKNDDLRHESYNYDELESLQGVVVPRCYGLFEGELPEGVTIALPGLDPKSGRPERSGAPPLKCLSGTVSMLVLERLGDPLPIGRKLPDDTLEEFMNMHKELAILGMEYLDIRHANYLQVLPSGLPSLPSPHEPHRAYRLRFVDLVTAAKTNQSIEQLEFAYHGWLERLITNLPFGRVYEPTI